ncbi:MAG TPA: DciA family protein [Waterburya sp.]|jgi:predicted nucleic acid-binding Zn ribbon protein
MLKSLNHILGAVVNQPQWQEHQQLQRLLQCWPEVVDVAMAHQTRPYAISRDVLYVATSGSVWAQELNFKRRLILKKLNTQLPASLIDIRCSTAGWQNNSVTENQESEVPSPIWQEHPSYVAQTPSVTPPEPTVNLKDSQSVFQRWSAAMQARSLSFPLCPNCQCPTPPGELQRWTVCGLCAAKHWQNS